MHREIRAAVGKRVFQFLDEQSLAADFGERRAKIAVSFGGHAEYRDRPPRI